MPTVGHRVVKSSTFSALLILRYETDVNFSIKIRCLSNDAIHFTGSHPPAVHLRRLQMAGTRIYSLFTLAIIC